MTFQTFVRQPHVLIFIGEKDLNTWVIIDNSSELHKFDNRRSIKCEILGRQTEPYVYIDTRGKIYLVQNVTDGIFENALIFEYGGGGGYYYLLM